MRRTAQLIAQWQSVGFAHGVMNTDNMSIHGLTLDYGPFGFMEEFDAGFVCNHSDETGRYAFDQQAQIAYWNLGCLAQALTPLVQKEHLLEALSLYAGEFNSAIHALMCRKLGLSRPTEDDRPLWLDLLDLLAAQRVDYTTFFRTIGKFRIDDSEGNTQLREKFTCSEGWSAWAKRYRSRLMSEQSRDAERQERMNRANPKYILRNYLAQAAIDKSVNFHDFAEIERLRLLLARPFDEQPEIADYAKPAPEWGKRLIISCSS